MLLFVDFDFGVRAQDEEFVAYDGVESSGTPRGETDDPNTSDSLESAVSGDEEGDLRQCILVSQIETYYPLDRSHVVIVGRGGRGTLLGTLRPSCWELPRSPSIALDTSRHTICAGETADLLVRGERCFIRSIETVESLEAAETLVSERN